MMFYKIQSGFDLRTVLYTLFSIMVLTIAFYIVANENWLNMTFKPNNDGYGIKISYINDPSLNSKLSVGDVIIALRSENIGTVAVDNETMRPRPSIYSRESVKNYLAFMNSQDKLYSLLQEPEVQLILLNGKPITVPVTVRKLQNIPIDFWIQILCAIASLVIIYRICHKQRGNAATSHFIISITGYFIMTCSWAALMSRPLALSGNMYHFLDVTSHLGIGMIIGGILSLAWCYPRRLEPRQVPLFIYSVYLFFWLIDTFKLIDNLSFAFYAPMFFAFALVSVFAVVQWNLTTKLPADRTVLKWMYFFIYSVCSFLLFFIFIPRTFGSFSLVSANLEFSLFLFFYLGIALVITRYRMVNLEFWWSFMWGGYFALTVSALIYFILISIFDLHTLIVFSIALFFGVLTFYPFRQWVKSRLKTAPQTELEQYLPTLVDILFTARSNFSLSTQWESILTSIFKPITLTSRKSPVSEVEIDKNGIILRVPDFQPEYAIELAYSNQGKRLFVQEDVRLAQTMYELTEKAINLNQAKNRGAEEERKRIVRDLHDDVGAKLITIIHRAGNSQVVDLCRSALQDIRDIMSYLGGGSYELLAMFADWRNEAETRCDAANIKLNWQQADIIPNMEIDSRMRMNLTRVYRESITNSIKHGEPASIDVEIDYLDKQFLITIKDDGIATDIDSFIKGRGLHNMTERMNEIGGTIKWLQNKPHGVIVKLSLEFSREEST